MPLVGRLLSIMASDLLRAVRRAFSALSKSPKLLSSSPRWISVSRLIVAIADTSLRRLSARLFAPRSRSRRVSRSFSSASIWISSVVFFAIISSEVRVHEQERGAARDRDREPRDEVEPERHEVREHARRRRRVLRQVLQVHLVRVVVAREQPLRERARLGRVSAYARVGPHDLALQPEPRRAHPRRHRRLVGEIGFVERVALDLPHPHKLLDGRARLARERSGRLADVLAPLLLARVLLADGAARSLHLFGGKAGHGDHVARRHRARQDCWSVLPCCDRLTS